MNTHGERTAMVMTAPMHTETKFTASVAAFTINLSNASMSLENRFKMRPVGVVPGQHNGRCECRRHTCMTLTTQTC